MISQLNPFDLLRRAVALLAVVYLLVVPLAHAASTPTSDFIDNDDGTVTHKITGLTWKRCVEGMTWTGSTCSDTASTFTWDQAMAVSYKGWLLPTKEQLLTIMDTSAYPAINSTIFPAMTENCCWSATGDVDYSGKAWAVSFSTGSYSSVVKSLLGDVLLFRIGALPPANNPITTSFTLTPSTQAVTPGGSFTLAAIGGTLVSCSSSGASVVLNPVTAGAAQVTGSLVQGATTGATVSCTSSSNQAATAQIIVAGSPTPLPSTSSGVAGPVAQGASVTLSEPSGKTLSNCMSFTPAMVSVTSSGATLTVSVAKTAAIGSEVSISCETSSGEYWYNTIIVSKEPTLTSFVFDDSALTITATVDGDATGYWAALPSTPTLTPPSAAQIKANMQASHGSSAMMKNAAQQFKLTGLLPGTGYQVFFYAEFTANSGNSEVKAATFHTPSIPEPVTTPLSLPTPLTVVSGENLSIAPISGKAVYCYASPDTLTAALDKNANAITLSASTAASGKALLTCVDSGGIAAKADVTLYPEGTLQIPTPSAMETGDSRDFTIIGTPTACTATTPGIVSATPRQNGLALKALKPGKTDLNCSNARARSIVIPITVNTRYPTQDAKPSLAGALVNGTVRMENPLNLTVRDNVSLQLALNVATEHQGKAVEPILVVTLGKGAFAARKSDGNWVGWDSAPASLPASGKKLLAGSQLTFNDIYEGTLPAGEYTLFAGYRYDDGGGVVPIVANLMEPLRIIVRQNY